MKDTGRKRRWFILGVSLLVFIAIGIGSWLLFGGFLKRYEQSVLLENAANLEDISNYSAHYIEETLKKEWSIAKEIASGISLREEEGEDELLAYLSSAQNIWGFDSAYLVNEKGFCVDGNGKETNSKFSPQIIETAKEKGRVLRLSGAKAQFMLPIKTSARFQGSGVVCIVVEKETQGLLDKLPQRTLKKGLRMLLVQQNGVIISARSGALSPETNTLQALIGQDECEEGGQSVKLFELLNAPSQRQLIRHSEQGDSYVIFSPVNLGEGLWYLISIAPVDTASAAGRFSQVIVYFGIAMTVLIALIALLMLLFFRTLFKDKRSVYDSEIEHRDELFELLTSQTGNAYAIISDQVETPVYINSNASGTAPGCESLYMSLRMRRYSVHNEDNSAAPLTEGLNRELRDWDGNGDFVSSPLPSRYGGRQNYFVLRIYPFDQSKDSSGEGLAVLQDVTKEHEREKALSDALIIADSANAAKAAFLSNVSHDIRAPMNAIVNMTDFAIESANEPEQARDYLMTIKRSSAHLLQLINDVLDMSRIESGKLMLASEAFALRDCIESICGIITPLCDAKSQRFVCEDKEITHELLLGDELRFKQVLLNLLNNAVKFTAPGGCIGFTIAEQRSLRADTACMHITISDNGMGISEKNLKNIFQPFIRDTRADQQKIEGSGLGLSIAKSFVEAMGGSIAVESREGEGTVFTLDLYFLIDQQRDRQETDEENLTSVYFSGRRALLVEDNEVNQRISKMLLSKMGLQVDVASDGKEGYESFVTSPPGYYDIIYMDIQMPTLNGYEAAAAIRASEHPQARDIPIMALTANVFAEDVEKVRQAGMDEHTGKPVSPKELKQKTKKLLGRAKKRS